MAHTIKTHAIKNSVEATVFGFLSTSLFIVTFLAVGDVLIAAGVAVATAITQIMLRQSSHRKVGILVWASLALVIALTGLTLNGDEADAASAPITVSDIKPVCACHGQQRLEASEALLPALKLVKLASVQ